MAVYLLEMVLFSPGKSCYSGAAAQRAEGVHQQSALERGLRRVRHRPLGLARGLARALQPPHGDAGQRGCQRRARSHEGAHRCVGSRAGQGCWKKLLRLFLVPVFCRVSSELRKLEFSSSLLLSLVPVTGCGIMCSAGVVRAGEGGAVLQLRAQQGL